MTVADVYISETNGGGGGAVQDDISQLNLGSIDQYELTSSSYPVTAGNRSFSKWVRIKLNLKYDSNTIDNFQVWMDSFTPATGIVYQTNLNTDLLLTTTIYPNPPTAIDFIGAGEGDVETASTFPTADPGQDNIGVGEAVGGLSSDGTYSDYIAIQLDTTGATPPGNLQQKTFHFQYDEQ